MGHKFYNTSKFTFASLLHDQEHLAANLNNYVNGFSPGSRDIFVEKFKFSDQIERLYDWLMSQMGIVKTSDYEWENVRKGYKRQIFKDIFYGDTRLRYTDTPLSRLFAKSFPNIWAFIKEAKKDGYEKLAQQMQRQEAQFVLHTVCKRLKDHHPHVPVLTIHDSLMVPPEHADDVHRIMIEEFMRLGLKPTIRIGKD